MTTESKDLGLTVSSEGDMAAGLLYELAYYHH